MEASSKLLENPKKILLIQPGPGEEKSVLGAKHELGAAHPSAAKVAFEASIALPFPCTIKPYKHDEYNGILIIAQKKL